MPGGVIVKAAEVCLPELGGEGRCRDGTSRRASAGNEEEERREEEDKEGRECQGRVYLGCSIDPRHRKCD